MKFFTPVKILEASRKIAHDDKLFLVGSCFSESIGEKLRYYGFNIVNNPFGIIYNPLSLFNALERVLNNRLYSENELMNYNGKWLSLDHHGVFSSTDKVDCLRSVNSALTEANVFIKRASTLFITLGSAWVYEYDHRIVANCHKLPGKSFNKRLLSVKEVLAKFQEVYGLMNEHLPNVNVVFTVSPVRHSKDGLHENNLSKSVLHLAIHNMVEQHDNCSYFPSYEIVIDELRGYRFFKDDLVHPNEMAINYVWQKFSEVYFGEETLIFNKEIEKIRNGLNHRPFDEESAEHQKFLEQLQDKVSSVQERYPHIGFK